MSRTKRFVEVKGGSSNQSMDFVVSRLTALFPFADSKDLEVAVFMDEDRNPEYCYHIFYSSTRSSQQLILMNLLNKTYAVDLGMCPMELAQGSIVKVGGISKHCFEGTLRRNGITMPWIKRNHAAISKKGQKNQKRRKVKKEKRCYQCQNKKSKFAELRLCGGCEQVRYCSRQCQKVSWNNLHRYECEFN